MQAKISGINIHSIPIIINHSVRCSFCAFFAMDDFSAGGADQLGRRKLRGAGNDRAAAADGQQNLCGAAAGDRRRHAFGDLAEHRVGKHNAERPDDKIDVGRADDNRIFTGSAALGAGFQHIGGCNAVCTDGNDFRLGQTFFQIFEYPAADAPPCPSITNTFTVLRQNYL